MAKLDKNGADQMERIEWQLDQIRQNVNLLAWIAILSVALVVCGGIVALLAATN